MGSQISFVQDFNEKNWIMPIQNSIALKDMWYLDKDGLIFKFDKTKNLKESIF